MATPVKTIKIAGVNYEICVGSDGKFSARFGTDMVHDHTLKGLENKLLRRAKLSSADLKIPYTYVDTRWYQGEVTISDGVATGLHAGNRNILCRVAGSKEPQQVHRNENVYRFTDDEKKELKELAKNYKESVRALNKFLAGHRIDLGKEVEDAIQQAIKADAEAQPKESK